VEERKEEGNRFPEYIILFLDPASEPKNEGEEGGGDGAHTHILIFCLFASEHRVAGEEGEGEGGKKGERIL